MMVLWATLAFTTSLLRQSGTHPHKTTSAYSQSSSSHLSPSFLVSLSTSSGSGGGAEKLESQGRQTSNSDAHNMAAKQETHDPRMRQILLRILTSTTRKGAGDCKPSGQCPVGIARESKLHRRPISNVRRRRTLLRRSQNIHRSERHHRQNAQSLSRS